MARSMVGPLLAAAGAAVSILVAAAHGVVIIVLAVLATNELAVASTLSSRV